MGESNLHIERNEPLSLGNPSTEHIPKKRVGFQRISHELFQYRWLACLLCSLINFFNYSTLDFYAILGTGGVYTIESRFYARGIVYNETMNQLAMTVSAWPSIFITLFAGILVDKVLGVRLTYIISQIIVVLSLFIRQVGIMTVSFPLLVIASLFSGLAGSTFTIGQNIFCCRFFKGHRGLQLSMGFGISAGRLGAALEFTFLPYLSERYGVVTAAWILLAIYLIMFLMAGTLAGLDYWSEKNHIINPDSELNDVFFKNLTLWERIKHMVGVYLQLPLGVWLLTCIAFFDYATSAKFNTISKNYLQAKYKIDMKTASRTISYYQWTAVAALPSFGCLIEFIGRNGYGMMVCGIGFTILHIIFLTLQINPILFMILLGLTYSLMSVIVWATIPLVSPERILGASHAMLLTMEQLVLAIFAIIIGKLIDLYRPQIPRDTVISDHRMLPDLKGYNLTEIIFIPSGIMSTICCCVLIYVDRRRNGLLNCTPAERVRRIREAEARRLNALNNNKEENLSDEAHN